MESVDVNYWNINTHIYTAAIILKGEIYSKQGNEITKQNQPSWETKHEGNIGRTNVVYHDVGWSQQ